MKLAAPLLPLPADPEAGAHAALAAGDSRAALEVLMDAYGDAVFAFALRLTRRRELAEEVLQTTFVQAFQGLPRFRGGSSFKTWLLGIARHRALDVLKVTGRRERRFRLVPALPERPAAEPGAEERLLGAATTRRLSRCLAELAPRVRATVLLRYQQEISYPDLAAATGERPAALQMRVARALPVLRRCLERGGGP